MSNTKNKYMKALEYIHAQPTFHSKITMRLFKVSNNFLTAGKELGLFKKIEQSQYKWNLSRQPMMSDVQDIQVRVRSYTQTHRLKAKPSPQLTIKPVRKAPAPAPMPVNAEPECDTTNSKMMLILGAGLLIGFMIATIIWK
jgi:hypothetical protein